MSCKDDPILELEEEDPILVVVADITSKVDSTTYNIGIPLYTADQGRKFWSEFNTQLRVLESSREVNTEFSRAFLADNPFLTCSFTWLPEEGFAGFRIATFATLFDNKPLSQKIGDMVTGVRFNARAIDAPMELTSEAIDLAGNVLTCKTFALEKEVFASYQLDITSSNIKALHFNIKKIEQVTTDTLSAGGFAIDDIYLMDGSTTRFTPPESERGIPSMAQICVLQFF